MCLIIIRTRIEEEKLLTRFGESYRAYMKRTGRWAAVAPGTVVAVLVRHLGFRPARRQTAGAPDVVGGELNVESQRQTDKALVMKSQTRLSANDAALGDHFSIL